MTKDKTTKQQCPRAVLMAMTCGVLLGALLLSSRATAAEEQYQHSEPAEMTNDQHVERNHHKQDEMSHDEPGEKTPTKPSEMNHNQRAGMEHEGHGETTGEPAVHVHPVQTDADEGKVGLDEKLGTIIPLDLVFTDERGKPVSLAELVTKPTVIAPVYYRCPNVCHFLQGDLARVLPGLKLKGGEDYQVISFSFDETEKPELAKRSRDTYYAAMKHQYPDKAWRFLTGDKETILQLTDAAGYGFQKVGTDFLHPVVFFVVSPEGKIVRYLHGTHILPKDLTLALYEAKAGTVGTTIRKMVQYCFSFDPEQKTYVFNILRVSATAILTTLAIFAAYLIFGDKKSKKDKNL
jgi:protein SCO1/2